MCAREMPSAFSSAAASAACSFIENGTGARELPANPRR